METERFCFSCGFNVPCMLTSPVYSWQTMEFCTYSCLHHTIEEILKQCDICQNLVSFEEKGRLCLRFGSEMHQFCSCVCLNKFKDVNDFCKHCSERLKDVAFVEVDNEEKFCSSMCNLRFYGRGINQINFKIKNVCANCGQSGLYHISKRSAQGGYDWFCTMACFKQGTDDSEEIFGKCNNCGFITKESEQNYYFKNGLKKSFCSKQCQSVFMLTDSQAMTCRQCKTSKYDFDMIKVSVEAKSCYFCSDACLRRTKKSRIKGTKKVTAATDENMPEDVEPYEEDLVAKQAREEEAVVTKLLCNKLEGMELQCHLNKCTMIGPETHTIGIQTDLEYCDKNEAADQCSEFEFYKYFPIPFPVYAPSPLTKTFPLYKPVPLIIPILIPFPIFFPLINGSEEEEEEDKEETSQEEDATNGRGESTAALNQETFSNSDCSDLNFLDDFSEEFIGFEIPLSDSELQYALKPIKNLDDECDHILKSLKNIDKTLINESSFGNEIRSLNSSHGLSLWNKWVEMKKHDGTYSAEFCEENLCLRRLSKLELNKYLTLLLNELKKADGTNYQPNVVYYLALCIQKYLSDFKFPHSIFLDDVFEKFSDTLNAILQVYLENNDIKNPIQTNICLVSITEEMLWESNQLGISSPSVLLFTIFYLNTKYLKLKSVKDHQMISFRRYIKSSSRTKLADGTIISSKSFCYVPPFGSKLCKPFKRNVCELRENKENPQRCPVKLSEFYISKCPTRAISGSEYFYLLPEGHCVADSPKWYSDEQYPAHTLEKMLNRVLMVEEVKEALGN